MSGADREPIEGVVGEILERTFVEREQRAGAAWAKLEAFREASR